MEFKIIPVMPKVGQKAEKGGEPTKGTSGKLAGITNRYLTGDILCHNAE